MFTDYLNYKIGYPTGGHIPVILSLQRWRQEDYLKFKASLKEIHTWQTSVDKAFRT